MLLRLTPATGYYLYRDKLSVSLDAGDGLTARLPPAAKLPKAISHRDEHFGDVAVYFDQVEITVPVARTRTSAAKGTLIVGLQGCQTDGICYPPMTRRLPISLPAGTLTPTVEVPAETIADPTPPASAAPVASAAASPVSTEPAPADAGDAADAAHGNGRGCRAHAAAHPVRTRLDRCRCCWPCWAG